MRVLAICPASGWEALRLRALDRGTKHGLFIANASTVPYRKRVVCLFMVMRLYMRHLAADAGSVKPSDHTMLTQDRI